MKDLPKVFANPINKDIVNNKIYSYDNVKLNNESISDKISKMFSNGNRSNRIACIITTKDLRTKHIIIGKTNNNLISINEELIPIKDIIDIETI